jgi:hypothetical protein
MGGNGGFGEGGGIFNANTGVLSINPRAGARKGSNQSRAIDIITGNQAIQGLHGSGGPSSAASTGGSGGTPNGNSGLAFVGDPGADGFDGVGLGGGIVTTGTATIDNTTITGNHASTNDDDVDGTISM